jgi:hypothetical protein
VHSRANLLAAQLSSACSDERDDKREMSPTELLTVARRWIPHSWWGPIAAYFALFILGYVGIWSLIEPASVPETFDGLRWLLNRRLFFHLAFAHLFASHLLLVLLVGQQHRRKRAPLSDESTALGIVRIFPTRTLYERAYPLENTLGRLDGGSQIRVVARSMFFLMSRAKLFKSAIDRGVTVDLCVLDPATADGEAGRLTSLGSADVVAALQVFATEIAQWVRTNKPKGAVQLRSHRLALFDTYSRIKGPDQNLVIWDLSFGRDLMEKRVFVLDGSKPLADDLTTRYDNIFDCSAVLFEYRHGAVKMDRLG